MKLLGSLRFRINTLLRRSQMNSDMEEELRSHIQHRADEALLPCRNSSANAAGEC